jgi:hypothetical protein
MSVVDAGGGIVQNSTTSSGTEGRALQSTPPAPPAPPSHSSGGASSAHSSIVQMSIDSSLSAPRSTSSSTYSHREVVPMDTLTHSVAQQLNFGSDDDDEDL